MLRMASLGVPNALAASSSVGDVECEFLVQPEMSVADLVRRRIRPFLIMLTEDGGRWWSHVHPDGRMVSQMVMVTWSSIRMTT